MSGLTLLQLCGESHGTFAVIVTCIGVLSRDIDTYLEAASTRKKQLLDNVLVDLEKGNWFP